MDPTPSLVLGPGGDDPLNPIPLHIHLLPDEGYISPIDLAYIHSETYRLLAPFHSLIRVTTGKALARYAKNHQSGLGLWRSWYIVVELGEHPMLHPSTLGRSGKPIGPNTNLDDQPTIWVRRTWNLKFDATPRVIIHELSHMFRPANAPFPVHDRLPRSVGNQNSLWGNEDPLWHEPYWPYWRNNIRDFNRRAAGVMPSVNVVPDTDEWCGNHTSDIRGDN